MINLIEGPICNFSQNYSAQNGQRRLEWLSMVALYQGRELLVKMTQCMDTYLLYTWRVYASATLPTRPTSPSPACVHVSVFHVCVSIHALDLNWDLEKREREEQRERALVPESGKGWHIQGWPSTPESVNPGSAGSSFHRVEDIVSTLITITVS